VDTRLHPHNPQQNAHAQTFFEKCARASTSSFGLESTLRFSDIGAMLKRRTARWLTALAVCVVVPCLSPNAEASQEAAKRYFQNGVDLITGTQPNYQDAYYQFQLAYQESAKSWKVLGNLGLCALKLERDQEAVAYYEQYLEKGRSEIAAEERNAIEQDLLLLKGNLATVQLTSPVQDLKLVDQRAGSSVPAQPYALQSGTLELRLRAGNHSITAMSGDRRLTWDIVLEPKAQATHVFDFDAEIVAPAGSTASATAAAPASGATTDQDAATARGSSALRLGGYAALGLGVVGVGVGGYFAWQSSDYSSKSEAAFRCDRQVGGCLPAQKTEVRRLEADSSDAKTRAAIALSVGGAALATGIVLLVIAPSSSSAAGKSAQVTPWVGYRSAGVSGRF
jgi:hypothetical protein